MALLALGVLSILAAGVARAVLSRRPGAGDAIFRAGLAAGGLAGAVPAIAVLAGATLREVHIAGPTPGGPWVFGLDALSAVFVLAIVAVGAASGFYGVTYLRDDHHRPAGTAHLLLALLIAALLVVVCARAVVPFLIAWEVMAISAYFLVVHERQRPEVRRAGLLYLAATHAGTLALFAMFAAWAGAGHDLTFAALAGRAALLPAQGALVLTLALLGFGVKAGIVPLHVWLPEAHAAAPSHVSAIMSGVVIKAGVYGLLRIVSLLGTPPAWWGWLVVALGAVSGVLGVLWALAQHDLKRLLAFHSVENIGIILVGAGAGSLGIAYGHPAMAVLGFAGAALHTLNHALFKSLLFLGAGATIRAAGSRDLDRLGGLARGMPWTAGAFVVGSAAIVGLPPLNGFVSEWLVYRALLSGAWAGDATRLAVLATAALALIGALALACFAKVVGVVYLGHRRDGARQAEREAAAEAPRGLLGPALALAAACAAIGLAPVLVLAPALRVGAVVGHAALARQVGVGAGTVATTGAGAAMGTAVARAAMGTVAAETAMRTAAAETAAGPLTVFSLALAAGLGLAWLLRARLTAPRRGAAAEASLRSAAPAGRSMAAPATAAITAITATWGCGYTAPTPRMQYTASSFAAPLLLAFGRLSSVRTERAPGAFASHAVDPVLAGLVLPAWRGLRAAADRLRRLQRGRLALYLVYMIAALLALLLYLMVAGRPLGGAS